MDSSERESKVQLTCFPFETRKTLVACESISQVFPGIDKHHRLFFNPWMKTFRLNNVVEQSQSYTGL